jgi:hypothetical protein
MYSELGIEVKKGSKARDSTVHGDLKDEIRKVQKPGRPSCVQDPGLVSGSSGPSGTAAAAAGSSKASPRASQKRTKTKTILLVVRKRMLPTFHCRFNRSIAGRFAD